MMAVLDRITSLITDTIEAVAPIALIVLMLFAMSKGDWTLGVLTIIAITLEQIRDRLVRMSPDVPPAPWESKSGD